MAQIQMFVSTMYILKCKYFKTNMHQTLSSQSMGYQQFVCSVYECHYHFVWCPNSRYLLCQFGCISRRTWTFVQKTRMFTMVVWQVQELPRFFIRIGMLGVYLFYVMYLRYLIIILQTFLQFKIVRQLSLFDNRHCTV